MMNKLFLALLSFMVVGIGWSSCKKNSESNNCFSLEKAPVVAIEGPSTAQVGQEITLRISFSCKNGCGDFDNFSTVSSGTVSTISVNARYTGCICTQDIPTRVASYKFKATQTGRYDLQFAQSGTAVLTHSIVVL